MTPAAVIDHAVITTAGAGRANQDCVLADPHEGTFVVADGIGGLADGADTARQAADALLRAVPPRPVAVREADVAQCLGEVSHEVRAAARLGPGTCGAAVAVAIVRHDVAVVGHLGDCRVLLLRAGGTRRLTVDHTSSRGLTRFVGMPSPVAVPTTTVVLRAGDLLLLHSDGLSVLDEPALTATLDAVLDGPVPATTAGGVDATHDAAGLAVACRALERRARASGARDDVSVVLARPGAGRGRR